MSSNTNENSINTAILSSAPQTRKKLAFKSLAEKVTEATPKPQTRDLVPEPTETRSPATTTGKSVNTNDSLPDAAQQFQPDTKPTPLPAPAAPQKFSWADAWDDEFENAATSELTAFEKEAADLKRRTTAVKDPSEEIYATSYAEVPIDRSERYEADDFVIWDLSGVAQPDMPLVPRGFTTADCEGVYTRPTVADFNYADGRRIIEDFVDRLKFKDSTKTFDRAKFDKSGKSDEQVRDWQALTSYLATRNVNVPKTAYLAYWALILKCRDQKSLKKFGDFLFKVFDHKLRLNFLRNHVTAEQEAEASIQHSRGQGKMSASLRAPSAKDLKRQQQSVKDKAKQVVAVTGKCSLLRTPWSQPPRDFRYQCHPRSLLYLFQFVVAIDEVDYGFYTYLPYGLNLQFIRFVVPASSHPKKIDEYFYADTLPTCTSKKSMPRAVPHRDSYESGSPIRLFPFSYFKQPGLEKKLIWRQRTNEDCRETEFLMNSLSLDPPEKFMRGKSYKHGEGGHTTTVEVDEEAAAAGDEYLNVISRFYRFKTNDIMLASVRELQSTLYPESGITRNVIMALQGNSDQYAVQGSPAMSGRIIRVNPIATFFMANVSGHADTWEPATDGILIMYCSLQRGLRVFSYKCKTTYDVNTGTTHVYYNKPGTNVIPFEIFSFRSGRDIVYAFVPKMDLPTLNPIQVSNSTTMSKEVKACVEAFGAVLDPTEIAVLRQLVAQNLVGRMKIEYPTFAYLTWNFARFQTAYVEMFKPAMLSFLRATNMRAINLVASGWERVMFYLRPYLDGLVHVSLNHHLDKLAVLALVFVIVIKYFGSVSAPAFIGDALGTYALSNGKDFVKRLILATIAEEAVLQCFRPGPRFAFGVVEFLLRNPMIVAGRIDVKSVPAVLVHAYCSSVYVQSPAKAMVLHVLENVAAVSAGTSYAFNLQLLVIMICLLVLALLRWGEDPVVVLRQDVVPALDHGYPAPPVMFHDWSEPFCFNRPPGTLPEAREVRQPDIARLGRLVMGSMALTLPWRPNTSPQEWKKQGNFIEVQCTEDFLAREGSMAACGTVVSDAMIVYGGDIENIPFHIINNPVNIIGGIGKRIFRECPGPVNVRKIAQLDPVLPEQAENIIIDVNARYNAQQALQDWMLTRTTEQQAKYQRLTTITIPQIKEKALTSIFASKIFIKQEATLNMSVRVIFQLSPELEILTSPLIAKYEEAFIQSMKEQVARNEGDVLLVGGLTSSEKGTWYRDKMSQGTVLCADVSAWDTNIDSVWLDLVRGHYHEDFVECFVKSSQPDFYEAEFDDITIRAKKRSFGQLSGSPDTYLSNSLVNWTIWCWIGKALGIDNLRMMFCGDDSLICFPTHTVAEVRDLMPRIRGLFSVAGLTVKLDAFPAQDPRIDFCSGFFASRYWVPFPHKVLTKLFTVKTWDGEDINTAKRTAFLTLYHMYKYIPSLIRLIFHGREELLEDITENYETYIESVKDYAFHLKFGELGRRETALDDEADADFYAQYPGLRNLDHIFEDPESCWLTHDAAVALRAHRLFPDPATKYQTATYDPHPKHLSEFQELGPDTIHLLPFVASIPLHIACVEEGRQFVDLRRRVERHKHQQAALISGDVMTRIVDHYTRIKNTQLNIRNVLHPQRTPVALSKISKDFLLSVKRLWVIPKRGVHFEKLKETTDDGSWDGPDDVIPEPPAETPDAGPTNHARPADTAGGGTGTLVQLPTTTNAQSQDQTKTNDNQTSKDPNQAGPSQPRPQAKKKVQKTQKRPATTNRTRGRGKGG